MNVLFLASITSYLTSVAVSEQEQTGPICFSCTGITNVLDCHTVERCGYGQLCYIQIDPVNFGRRNLGCRDVEFCPSTELFTFGKRKIAFVNKRNSSTAECQHCCSKDLCNNIECSSMMGNNPSTLTPEATQASTTSRPTSPQPHHGEFGEWSSWTRCPYSCGKDGLQHRFRHCNEPSPQNGEHLCIGPHIDTKFCHNAPCCRGPPVITFIDNDVTTRVGNFVTLHCNATHWDTLFWEGPKIVGQKFPENVRVVAGLNLLQIDGISYNNTGYYKCIAQNLCGTTEKYVNVYISN